MMTAGAAMVDITPPPGLAMAGFAARTEPATGVHDPLTARAVVVGDTALLAVDLIGLPEESGRRIRERCVLPADRVVLAAIHTHGAPTPRSGRFGGGADPAFVKRIEDGCVAAIDRAHAEARPATITAGWGDDPDVGRNRRHAGGPVDRSVPVVRIRGTDGTDIAVIVSYACHPVVLGADNRLMAADYPHFVRRDLEAAYPGAVAVFLTGCAGDVNTGHSAHDSWTQAANTSRTFAMAEQYGTRIARAAQAAADTPAGEGIGIASREVTLEIARREPDLPAMVAGWRREAETADPVRRIVLETWTAWAETFKDVPADSWTGRVAVLQWGAVPIVVLPGEIFAQTGLDIRSVCGETPALVISYGEGIPGYIPPQGEYQFGGYEVEEAHRFAGRPGAFVPGSAESLAAAAKNLVVQLKRSAGSGSI